MSYVIYNSRTNKYFKNGDFIADNKSDADLLDKSNAEELQRKLNGVMMSKPIKIEIV